MRTIAALLLGLTLLAHPAASQTVSKGWLSTYGPDEMLQPPTKIISDAAGNTYITGTTHVGNDSPQVVTVKYSPSGAAQWTAIIHNSPLTGIQGAYSAGIAVDPNGNVYVGCSTYASLPTGVGQVFTVVKYSATGALLQADTAYSNYGATLTAIAVDAGGNIYLTGDTYYDDPNLLNTYNLDYYTVKLGANGTVLWRAAYNGTADGEDIANAIVLDAAGNVYITGYSMGQTSRRLGLNGGIVTYSQGFDYVTIKYNSSGTALWTQRWNDAGNGSDIPCGLVVDNSGNVYVAGSGVPTAEMVCYNSSGAQSWTNAYPNSSFWTGIALAPSGNVAVAGAGVSADGNTVNYLTVSYTPAGAISWYAQYYGGNNPLPQNLGGPSLAIDSKSNVYVAVATGSDPANPPATRYDYTVIAYSPTGTQTWVQTYNDPENLGDYPSGITVVNPRNPIILSYASVYVTGLTDSYYDLTLAPNPTWTTIQYTQTSKAIISDPLSAQNGTLAETSAAALLAPSLGNAPNPFHGATTITYTLPQDGHVILQIYDGAGRPIATLANDDENAGPHTLPFNANRLAAGIYQYRIIAQSPQGTFTQTKQMIIQ